MRFMTGRGNGGRNGGPRRGSDRGTGALKSRSGIEESDESDEKRSMPEDAGRETQREGIFAHGVFLDISPFLGFVLKTFAADCGGRANYFELRMRDVGARR